MKKTTLLQGAVMAALVLILCIANSSGPASNGNRYTGAPGINGGNEFTCFICHTTGAADFGEPQVSWTIAATEGGINETTYVPGETYYITVNVSAPIGSPVGYGFSSTFLQGGTNDNAGTPFATDDNSKFFTVNGRTYIEHSNRTPSGTWNFRWIAPEQGTGIVNIYSAGNSGNGADSNFGDSGSTSPTIITLTETLLPVTLTEFDAVADKSIVKLRWSTASENDASHFEVERSADGHTFLPVGSLAAYGNTGQINDYTFIDQEAPVGNIYYRLRMVDLSGTFAFGPVVQVRVTTEGKLLVYPNPAVDQVFIGGEVTETTTVRILDGTGRILRSRRGAGALNVADLQSGVYLVETVQEGIRSISKLVKR